MNTQVSFDTAPLGPVSFDERARREADVLIDLALEEDLPDGDLTSDTLFPPDSPDHPRARLGFVAREPGVACGGPIVEQLF
ncbi:MAG: hypothetical protein AAF517_22010, partial [Planctomycetota bacterium]